MLPILSARRRKSGKRRDFDMIKTRFCRNLSLLNIFAAFMCKIGS